MSITINKISDLDNYLKVRAACQTLSSRNKLLLITDRFIQATTRSTVIRFFDHSLPKGVYLVQQENVVSTRLYESDRGMNAREDVFEGGGDWQVDTMECSYPEAMANDMTRIADRAFPLNSAKVVSGRYPGQKVTVLHCDDKTPVIITAPGMALAILPHTKTVDRHLTGLREDVNDYLKITSIRTGVSVNRIILDCIYEGVKDE